MRDFQRLLFCTDFSENAGFAFDYAAGLAARSPGCELRVLHVLPEPAAQFWRGYINADEHIDERTRAEIDAHLEAYRSRAPAGLEFQAVARFGKPGEEILDYAKSAGVDLILLGRKGHGSLFFGDTAAHVTRRAECPVLVVPADFMKNFP